jgi:hypothetical protein
VPLQRACGDREADERRHAWSLNRSARAVALEPISGLTIYLLGSGAGSPSAAVSGAWPGAENRE